jgi:hypothetical protein
MDRTTCLAECVLRKGPSRSFGRSSAATDRKPNRETTDEKASLRRLRKQASTAGAISVQEQVELVDGAGRWQLLENADAEKAKRVTSQLKPRFAPRLEGGLRHAEPNWFNPPPEFARLLRRRAGPGSLTLAP